MGVGHTQTHMRQANAEVHEQKDALVYAGTESTPYIPPGVSVLEPALFSLYQCSTSKQCLQPLVQGA